jgi:hypothetical protein
MTHFDIVLQEFLSVGLRQGDGIGNLGAARLLAEMSIAYSGVASGVDV